MSNVPNLYLSGERNRATFRALAVICEAATYTYRIRRILEVLGLEIDHFEIPSQTQIQIRPENHQK